MQRGYKIYVEIPTPALGTASLGLTSSLIGDYNVVRYQLDLYPNQDPLLLSWKNSDTTNIDIRPGNSSYSFNVPLSGINKQAFGFITSIGKDYTLNSSFNPLNIANGIIMVDGSIVFKGTLQLTQYSLNKKNFNNNAQITIFDTTAYFYKQMGDFYLNNLSSLSSYNHIWGSQSIINSWTASWTNGYYYGLIDYGDNWSILEMEFPNVGTGQYVSTADFYPGIYAKTYLQAISDFTGFYFQSNFITGDQYFDNAIVPFSNENLQIPGASIYEFSAGYNNFNVVAITYSGATYGPSPGLPYIAYSSLPYNNTSTPYGDTYSLWNTTSSYFTQPVYPIAGTSTPYSQQFGTNISLETIGYWDTVLNTWDNPTLAQVHIAFMRSTVASASTSGSWGGMYSTVSSPTSSTPKQWWTTNLINYGTIPFSGNVDYQVTIPPGRPSNYFITDNLGNLLSVTASGPNTIAHWVYNINCVSDYLDGHTINGQYRSLLQGEHVWASAELLFSEVPSNKTASYITYSIIGNINSANDMIWNNVNPNADIYQLIDVQASAPKNKKIKEMFQDFANIYNWRFEPSKQWANTLVIEPRDQFYAGGTFYTERGSVGANTNVLTWGRVDLSQPIDFQPISNTQPRTILFTWKQDNDYYNETYRQNFNQIYGQNRYTINNEYTTEEKKNENGFSPTPLVQIPGSNGFIVPKIGKLDNNGIFSRTGMNARLLQRNNAGLLPCLGIDFWKYRTDNSLASYVNPVFMTFSVYPYIGHFDNPENPSFDLNWAEPQEFFYSIYNTAGSAGFNGNTYSYATYSGILTNNTLVNTYYYNQLQEYNDPSSMIVTCHMYLTPLDIANFSFRNQVYIIFDDIGAYYKVLEINGWDAVNPGKTCEVKLLLTKNITVPKTNTYVGNPKPGGGGINTGGTVKVAPNPGSALTTNGSNTSVASNVLITGLMNKVGLFGGGSKIGGFVNSINSAMAEVTGNNNTIEFGATYSTSHGYGNRHRSNSSNSTTFGNNNDIGIQSQNVFVLGNNAQIGANNYGVFALGDNIVTATSQSNALILGTAMSIIFGDGSTLTSSSVDANSNVNNGLTYSGGFIGLGGLMNQLTTILTNDAVSYLTIQGYDGFNTGAITTNPTPIMTATDSTGNYSQIGLNSTNAGISSQDNFADTGSINSVPGSITLSVQNIFTGTSSSLLLNLFNNQTVGDGSTNNSIVITDFYNKGMVYNSDYSANFTTYSLVDKGYVDGKFITGSAEKNSFAIWNTSTSLTGSFTASDSYGTGSIDIQDRTLIDSQGFTTFNWNNSSIFPPAGGATSGDFSIRELWARTGVSVAWQSTELVTPSVGQSLNWGVGNLIVPSTTTTTLNWFNAQGYDLYGNLSIDWNNRLLIGSGSSNWNFMNNPILTGTYSDFISLSTGTTSIIMSTASVFIPTGVGNGVSILNNISQLSSTNYNYTNEIFNGDTGIFISSGLKGIHAAHYGTVSTIQLQTIGSQYSSVEFATDTPSQSSSITLSSDTQVAYDGTSNNVMIVLDGISSKGLAYTSNYSSNFTTASIVDKNYIDTHTNGTTQSMFSTQYVIPSTGNTITSNGSKFIVANPSGSLLALTIVFPTGAVNGQQLVISISQIITTLTLTPGSGDTIDGTITTSAANSFGQWVYIKSATTWFKCG